MPADTLGQQSEWSAALLLHMLEIDSAPNEAELSTRKKMRKMALCHFIAGKLAFSTWTLWREAVLKAREALIFKVKTYPLLFVLPRGCDEESQQEEKNPPAF